MPSGVMEAIVDRLASASIAIALIVAVAWLACRLRPSLAPSTRSTIWWLVAVAALVRLAPLPVLTLEVPAAWLGGLRPVASRAAGRRGDRRHAGYGGRAGARAGAGRRPCPCSRRRAPGQPVRAADRTDDRRVGPPGVAVRLAHSAGRALGPRRRCAVRPPRSREPAAATPGRRRRARARCDRRRGRAPRPGPGPAPHARRPRLHRHRDAASIRPAAPHRAAARRHADGADAARARDDAVPRAGARPPPRSRLRLGARRDGAPAVLPPRSPAGGARICVRARSRLRCRRAAAPRRSAARLRSAPPPPRGHPAAGRARRGAVVTLDAIAPKETRDVERSRTLAAHWPRHLAGGRHPAPAARPPTLARRPPGRSAPAAARTAAAPGCRLDGDATASAGRLPRIGRPGRWCRRRRRWRHRLGHRLGRWCRSRPRRGWRDRRWCRDRRSGAATTATSAGSGSRQDAAPAAAPTAPAGRPARALLDRRGQRRQHRGAVRRRRHLGLLRIETRRQRRAAAARRRQRPVPLLPIERQDLHVARSRPDRSGAERDAPAARARAETGRARRPAGGAGRAAGSAGRAAGRDGRARRGGRRRDGHDGGERP